MADYTKRIERDRYTDELLARPRRPEHVILCGCGAPARWQVYGKLCCARCVPERERPALMADATPDDLKVWNAPGQ